MRREKRTKEKRVKMGEKKREERRKWVSSRKKEEEERKEERNKKKKPIKRSRKATQDPKENKNVN